MEAIKETRRLWSSLQQATVSSAFRHRESFGEGLRIDDGLRSPGFVSFRRVLIWGGGLGYWRGDVKEKGNGFSGSRHGGGGSCGLV
ncbi:hypothetical protein L2E82_13828 [Cichorium intybus]|uniref:Uncharacterized protein n=1 Tax=Cichorium intybus TaxID=13427 RepID=A0ACB9EYM7_CICIN|nr:hypothetical protein L2E82_13828 [Cichorium intybus]